MTDHDFTPDEWETICKLCRESSYLEADSPLLARIHSMHEVWTVIRTIKWRANPGGSHIEIDPPDLMPPSTGGEPEDREAWKRCPQHGPYCIGDDCCCADQHVAGAESVGQGFSDEDAQRLPACVAEQKLEEAEARVRYLEAALRFYADRKNWDFGGYLITLDAGREKGAPHDYGPDDYGGRVARHALEGPGGAG